LVELTWQILSQHVLYDGLPWLRLSSEHVRLPNGVEITDFYRIEMRSYVSIFALTKDHQVALVEHYKHGPGMVSLELPAGYIEEGDDPLETAKRELREETGLTGEDWLPLGRYFIDGNRGCGWNYGFLVQNVCLVGEPQLENTEVMTLHFKPLEKVYALWYAGEITNAAMLGIVGYALARVGYLGNKR
jgi:ADP-ribose pyrophosphatase